MAPLPCCRYAHPKQLCIQGTSAGGWIVAALLNVRPATFCAAVLTAASVDVITSMLEDGHAWGELGDPRDAKVR